MKLDKNMGMLVGAILLIVVTLGGSLFLSLRAMQEVTSGMTDRVIPIGDELSGVSESLANAFEWQSRLNATVDQESYDEVMATRADASLDAHLLKLRTLFEQADAVAPEGAQERLSTLDRELAEFREQKTKLTSSVGRRHGLNARFNERVLEVNKNLGTFLQQLESLQGRVRLDYVSKLAALDESVTPASVRAITHGSDRATYDALQDLRPEAIRLGVQLGKIGLTNDLDSLNSIVANEVGPTVGSVKRRLDDTQELVSDNAAHTAEVQQLRKDFLRVVELGSGETEDSLRGLRRSILDEIGVAADVRDEFQTTASNLGHGAEAVQADAKSMVAELKKFAVVSVSQSQWIAILAGLVALVAVAMALQRIAQSVRNLRTTNAELVKLKEDLETANSVLESKVQERTEALAQRELAVRGLLNGLAEGVLEVSVDGLAGDERSAVVTEWFGPQAPGQPAAEYLFDLESQQVSFAMELEQVAMDILPVELCLDQMPSRRTLENGRVLEFNYRPAPSTDEDGAVKALLVIIQDITSRLEAERAQRETQEFQRLVQHLLEDRDGFVRFVEDGSGLIAKLKETKRTGVVKLVLHTLKGNCAVYGAAELAEISHDLETALQDAADDGEPRLPTASELESISEGWDRMLERVAVFSSPTNEEQVSVVREELEHLVDLLKPVDSGLSERLELWLLEPMEAELQRVGVRAERVAEKIGKMVDVDVQSHGLRTTPGFARELLGELIHVIRNAVDHGIEDAELRAERGKSARGSLKVEAALHRESELRISITDDGGGIDWTRLRAIGAERGLPHSTHEELVELMFSSGVSTAEQVTELSGRGVGTTATKRACEALGGHVEVHSEHGKGTEIAFIVPLSPTVKVKALPVEPAPAIERAS
ncbi:MAG: ATP-binding protein [Nannocystales bacterium]